MKKLNQYIQEKFILSNDTKPVYKYFPKDKNKLRELILNLIGKNGQDADLNNIDTSKITDMSYLFANISFNGDISKWNVENVTDMNHMFMNSTFAGDISNWKVTDGNLYDMFEDCPLEQCPPKWYLDWKHQDLG